MEHWAQGNLIVEQYRGERGREGRGEEGERGGGRKGGKAERWREEDHMCVRKCGIHIQGYIGERLCACACVCVCVCVCTCVCCVCAC